MPSTARFRQALAPAAIILAAFLAFGLTLRAGFLWDDHRMIEQNPRISASAANLAAAFVGDPFSQGLNYYRPLLTVSFMADFSAWGLRPFGYHLANLLLHAATGVLLFYLALALGFARGASFWAAALLAAHPAAAEQLLIVSGRAELASSACTAASLLLLVKGRTAWAFVLFLAATGFKENGVITPALAALCFWRLGRPRKDYSRLIPFFAFIPAYLLVRHWALGMGLLSHGAAPVISGLFTRVPAAVLLYLQDTLLPFWMHSHRMLPDSAVLRWSALPLLAAGAALVLARGGKDSRFCSAWYLLCLAPKLPLLAANDLVLNHWVYLSNAGLLLWISSKISRDRLRLLAPAAAALLIAASARNITLRDTDLKIYEHAAARSSSKPMLHNLAREYYLAGRFADSRRLLERISAEAPGDPAYLGSLGLARWKDGDTPGALAALDAALAEKPEDPDILFNKYSVLRSAGRPGPAGEAMALLLRSAPAYPPALLSLARDAAAAGRTGEAEAAYKKLLSASPHHPGALNDYGILLASRGDYAAAGEMFRRALRVDPGLKGAAANLRRLEALGPAGAAANGDKR